MKKSLSKQNWRKLDNTAKIFSLDDSENTNIFRYSVILKQNIDHEILSKALHHALKQYPAFQVKIGTGFFWNYLEWNPKAPIIQEEDEIPCQHINFKKNNDYLFKVTYYKNKINLDVFHVLTDGIGAIGFLKSIIGNYLDIQKSDSVKEVTENNLVRYQDQCLKNYDKTLKVKYNTKKAFALPGKVNKNINNTYHYILNIEEVKKVCKKYGVTITEYFTAMYIYAIYLSFGKNSKKEIIITVPIDLRKYYKVDTLSNFFTCMNINPKIRKEKNETLDKILNQVHIEFQSNLEEDKVKSYLAKDVKLGMNIMIRLVPLFVKKLFIKFLGKLVNQSCTSTLSNVGTIHISDRYQDDIDNILALVIPGRTQKIKCTICSFENKLNVTMNSNIDDKEFENTFLNLLKNELDNIKLESNL